MALDHRAIAREIESSVETDANGKRYVHFRLVMEVNGIVFNSRIMTRKKVVSVLRSDYAIENLTMVQAKSVYEDWETQ